MSADRASAAISYVEAGRASKPAQDALFHPGHTWVQLHGERLATVGASSFAGNFIGEIASIRTPDQGRYLRQAEPACTLVSTRGRELEIPMPVDGHVLAVNEDVKRDPRLLQDRPYDKGWLRPLNRALYPPVVVRQDPGATPGVPAFKGKDTVLRRPDGQQPDASTVRPGAYRLQDPESGHAYTVAWWDPLLLEHTADDARGLRREDLITKDAAPERVAADRAAFDEWAARREATIQAGAEPSLRVQTATEYAAQAAAAALADEAAEGVVVEDAAVIEARPSGRRFGTLVHAMLAAVPLDAGLEDVRALAELHARLLGATEEERGVAAITVHRVLRHPRLAAAREAQAAGRRVWREVPLSIVRPPSLAVVSAASLGAASAPHPAPLHPAPLHPAPVLVDGQCDLAYETAEGWVVIDFKTDVVMATDETYRRQVALYAEAIARATNRPACGVLLRV